MGMALRAFGQHGSRSRRGRFDLGLSDGMRAALKIKSSGRLLRRRHLCGCRVSPEFEAVDLIFRILDCSFGIGPGKAHLDRGKQNSVDHDGLSIGAANPGMPQTSSRLERLDRKAVMVHLATPADFRGRGNHEPVDRNVKPFTSDTLSWRFRFLSFSVAFIGLKELNRFRRRRGKP
jgi:hypothetical protein